MKHLLSIAVIFSILFSSSLLAERPFGQGVVVNYSEKTESFETRPATRMDLRAAENLESLYSASSFEDALSFVKMQKQQVGIVCDYLIIFEGCSTTKCYWTVVELGCWLVVID